MTRQHAPWLRRLWGKTGLADNRAEATLLLVAFVDAVGRGLFLAGATFFYTQVVKLSNIQVGIGLSLAGLVGLACAVPIGRLADRIGAGRTLIGLQVWRAACFCVYPFVTDFHLFLLVACLIGAVEQAVWPIIQALAGSIAQGASYVKTISKVSVVRNVAYTLSAGIVALIIGAAGGKTAMQALLIANAAAFLASALMLLFARLPAPAARAEPRGEAEARRPFWSHGSPFRDRNFLLLSLLNGFLSLHAAAMNIALPLWILTKTDAPKASVGVLLAVNTVLTVALQLRFSRGGDQLAIAARKQLYAGLSLAGFCVLAALTDTPNLWLASALLLLCTVVLTFGELWQSAGAWGLSFGLAPERERAYYLSVYSLGTTVMAIIGPGLLPIAVVEKGMAGWLTFAALFAVAGLAVPFLAQRASRQPAFVATPAEAKA